MKRAGLSWSQEEQLQTKTTGKHARPFNQEAATVLRSVKGEVVGPTQVPWGLLGLGPKSSAFKQL